ncbi:expressed unknown protein [Seminavis robusta]|uniref:Uncharacterized protein n=1 Tax=Seminavis robusta TaxID=568900 RepID=A0A9N8HCC6_9STRA|nr:expressed unknown protein [Seminavis robusta]|eukprot:Sro214_g088700.1 n/a (142) ;mRNA; f:28157-28742
MKFLLLLCWALLGSVSGFNPMAKNVHSTMTPLSPLQPADLGQDYEATSPTTLTAVLGPMAGLTTGLVTFAGAAFAGEEIEMAELPPPYVPAIFAVGLLVGVGVLTGSLGNVIDEEASLGLQSGARARKEIERSRSSYFKKR